MGMESIAGLAGSALGFLGSQSQADAQREANEANKPQYYGPGMEYVPGILSDANRFYDEGRFDPQVNPLQLLGRENTLGYAEGLLPSLIGSAQGSWERALNGGINPYTTQMIQAAQNDLVQDYQRNVLPAISDAAQGAGVGGLGGSRQGAAQGVVSEGLLEGLGDISTRLLSDSYREKLGHERAAWQSMNDMLAAGFMPSDTQQNIGELYRQDYAQPVRNLLGYQGVVNPYVGNTGGSAAQPVESPWAGALTGAGIGLDLWDRYRGQQPQAPAPQPTFGNYGPSYSSGAPVVGPFGY